MYQLGGYELNKVSLSCFDDKRYIYEDGITSYAYGQIWRCNVTAHLYRPALIIQRFNVIFLLNDVTSRHSCVSLHFASFTGTV